MKLVFIGDLSCTGIFRKSILSEIGIFNNNILLFIKSTDNVICNFEGAATDLPNLYRTDLCYLEPLIIILKIFCFHIINKFDK